MNDLSLYEGKFFKEWEEFAGQISLIFDANVRSEDEEVRPLAAKQARYLAAILTIAKLLANIGQKETSNHFFLLAEAMQDLVSGIPHPLFKVETPAPKGGRIPDTSEVWRIRANLCIGIEHLIAGGTDQESAINVVVTRHKGDLGRLLRPGANLSNSLRTWLKSFANEEVSNTVALDTYRHGIKLLNEYKRTFPGDHLQRAGHQLITTSAERARKAAKI